MGIQVHLGPQNSRCEWPCFVFVLYNTKILLFETYFVFCIVWNSLYCIL